MPRSLRDEVGGTPDDDMTSAGRLTITPLPLPFGARVDGLDITRPLARPVVRRLVDAFEERSVLVFTSQRITYERLLSFSRYFGRLETSIATTGGRRRALPIVVTLSNRDPEDAGHLMDWADRRMVYQRGSQAWHTDRAFTPSPPKASLFCARVVPPAGGETEFASMRHAYATLPPATRRSLKGRVAVHSFLYAMRTLRHFDPDEEADQQPVRHPVVQTNPVNGRDSLFIGSHAWYVEDAPYGASRRLLERLLTHTTRPEVVYRHRWRPGDVIMWDNRCILHRGRPWDAARYRRVTCRTTLAGEGPTADPPFARRTSAWAGIIPPAIGPDVSHRMLG